MSRSRYSAKQRIMAVEDYLSGRKRIQKICSGLGFSSRETVRRWVLLYQSQGAIAFDTSKVFQKKLQEQGTTQSMSRVGCCIDNGPTEGFWGIIKSEIYYISDFSTEEELRQAIAKYIQYYNSGRYQECFNNLTPMEVRNAALHSKQPTQIRFRRISVYKLIMQN